MQQIAHTLSSIGFCANLSRASEVLLETSVSRVFSLNLLAGGVGVILQTTFSWQAVQLLGSSALCVGVVAYVVTKMVFPYLLCRSLQKEMDVEREINLRLLSSRFTWALMFDTGSDLGLIAATAGLILPWVSLPAGLSVVACSLGLGYAITSHRIHLLVHPQQKIFQQVARKAQALLNETVFPLETKRKVATVCYQILWDYVSLGQRKIRKSFFIHTVEVFTEKEKILYAESLWKVNKSYRYRLLQIYRDPLAFLGKKFKEDVFTAALHGHFLEQILGRQKGLESRLMQVKEKKDYGVILQEFRRLRQELRVLRKMACQQKHALKKPLLRKNTQIGKRLGFRIQEIQALIFLPGVRF